MIIFTGNVDHAHLCHRIARALTAAGRPARVFVAEAHPYAYQEDLVGRAGVAAACALAREAEWVISTGDGDYSVFKHLLATLPFRPDVKLAVTHAGTAYRQWPDRYNKADPLLQVPGGLPGARLRFIGMDSLYLARLGHTPGAFPDPLARPYFGTCPMITETLVDAPRVPHVTHTPSRRGIKGTALIQPVLEKLTTAGAITMDVIENATPDEVIRRRAAAHIHVDQLNRDIGGFGQSAIEALGVGCAVLASMHFVSTNGFVPAPPIIGVRTAQELAEWLTLLAKDREVLARYRTLSWEWARAHAAPAAVAAYWGKQLGLDHQS